MQTNKNKYTLFLYLKLFETCRGVAQFGSALALGARGCQFESGHPDHFKKGSRMAHIRVVFLSSVFVLSSLFTASCASTDSNTLEQWQITYLNGMTPEELQFTANFLYLSYAIALVELKIRQFLIPISRLNQSVRTNIATYQNTTDALATLRTLIERLSYITGARTIYMETLNTCSKYHTKHTTPTINAALESIQQDAQITLRAWADDKANETAEHLKKSSEDINACMQHLQAVSGLHKGMSEGDLPLEISEENEHNKSLIVLDIILRNNPEFLKVTEHITNTLNQTSDHAAQIINTGAEIYKKYYTILYSMISSPSFNQQYAKTLFGMYDVLSEEYKTLLPDTDHVFEHMLQTTKLYTQTELSQQ